MPIEYRPCIKCRNVYARTAENFVSNPQCADGLEGICKTCRNRRVRDHKRKNALVIAAARRARYQAEGGATHKRQEINRQQRDPFLVRAQTLCAGMRSRAKSFRLPFDATVFAIEYMADRLKQSPNCECCKRPLEIEFPKDNRKTGPRDRSPTADRIIPSKGYTFKNVAILCWRCNNLKRDATAEELEMVAAWMRVAGESA